MFNYAMLVDGEIAGSTGLMARIGPRGLEIGYWVRPGVHPQGAGDRRCRCTCRRRRLRCPASSYVQIVHDELNVPSGGIPRKLGFTEIERRPLDHKPLGGTGMGVVWEITRHQWEDAGPR